MHADKSHLHNPHLQCDIRDEEAVQSAIDATVAEFGGIDILINNASAINLANTETTDMKRYRKLQKAATHSLTLTAIASREPNTSTLLPSLAQLRPDALDQHARHLPVLQAVHPPPAQVQQRAHSKHLAAPGHVCQVVCPTRRLHHGQVWHVHVCSWHGRGAA